MAPRLIKLGIFTLYLSQTAGDLEGAAYAQKMRYQNAVRDGKLGREPTKAALAEGKELAKRMVQGWRENRRTQRESIE